jgi:DNA-binding transcriptional ArsR family regulator
MLHCFYFQVAVKVDAELQRPTSHKIGNTVQRIVEKYQNSVDLFVENSISKGLENALSQLVLSGHLMILVSTSSSSYIRCYFICLRRQGLKRLREHFESGVMENLLNEVFTLLADINEPIVIHRLRWSSKEYLRSMQQLIELRNLG